MAEEIKNEVENEEEKETKVKKTLGQKLDATLEKVASVPKKIGSTIVSGGKKAGVAVVTGLAIAFGAGVLLDKKGVFGGSLDTNEEPSNLIEGCEEAVVVNESTVIDVEPEVVESEDEV